MRSISVFICLLFLCSCSSRVPEPSNIQDYALGTPIVINAYGDSGNKAARLAIDEIKKIDSKMSPSNTGSDVFKLNAGSGKGSWVNLDKETIDVLEISRKFSVLSNGALDITLGRLIDKWGISVQRGTPELPSKNQINQLLQFKGMEHLEIDSRNNTARLTKKGVAVDLGAVAKGYAGDRVRKILEQNGIKSALVNLGGSIVAIGKKPDGKLWSIGIQNPRDTSGQYIGIVSLTGKAVSTSGDYERYFTVNGKRYHHIINPSDGYPANSGLISVTIISENSAYSDALSTAAFVLGLEKGKKLVESVAGTDAVFITSDKKVYITPGLKDVFKFEDQTKEFQYVKEG